MKNIKDITISIFAAIGFVAIITAFTNQPEQPNQQTVPESHVWTFSEPLQSVNYPPSVFSLNKQTGEVRRQSLRSTTYVVISEYVPKKK